MAPKLQLNLTVVLDLAFFSRSLILAFFYRIRDKKRFQK